MPRVELMSGPAPAEVGAASPGPAAPVAMSDAEFALLRDLIRRESGIHLNGSKKPLLQGRLARRLRELGLRSFRAYYRAVVDGPGPELIRMLDCVCTHETAFFRGPQQFEFLEERVFPEWRRRSCRTVRAWSAGCATGEEPYSLAMLLLDRFRRTSGWRVEVLATDLSTRALAQARAGVWAADRARDIPPRLLKAFMLRGVGSQSGRVKAGPELQAAVHFERLNLNDGAGAEHGEFDLILCRNVLIYFDGDGRLRVVERLLRRLCPDGHLVLGQSESLVGQGLGAVGVGPNVYRRCPETKAPGRGAGVLARG